MYAVEFENMASSRDPKFDTDMNKGFEIWNSLDEKISNIRSYFTFKIKSKIFFLEYI